MSLECMQAIIRTAIGESGLSKAVAWALLNDFFRAMHEVHYKAGRNQETLLEQLQSLFNPAVAQRLGRIIATDVLAVRSLPNQAENRLEALCHRFCAQRGVSFSDAKGIFLSAIRALDEERFLENGDIESVMFLAYWSLSDEAAYHLAGMHVGDDCGMAFEELKYLDSSLARFRTVVERWEIELAWEIESNT